MPSCRALLKSATAAVALSIAAPMAHADSELSVVATFSILGDMVAQIGGEHVEVTTLVGPEGDAHVYQPTPNAARAVAEANVLVMNGLEFEGGLERLTEAAGFNGAMAVATAGITPIALEDDHGDHDDHHDDGHDDDHHDDEDHDDHADDAHGHDDHHDEHDHDEAKADDDHDHDHGEDHEEHAHDAHGHEDEHGHDDAKMDDDHAHEDHDDHGHDDHADHDHGEFDPHAWQSAVAAITYVDNITAALAQADPSHAGVFYENRAAYVAELEALNAEIVALMATIPEDKRVVVTSHDAFGYFAEEYGIEFKAPQGQSTESEASASDVAALITQIRDEGISAVFVENITDNRLMEQIANETGAVIGGTLYSGALSGPDGPASTYIDMLRHNATTVAAALGS